MSIKMADSSVLNLNIRRSFLDAACNGNPLLNISSSFNLFTEAHADSNMDTVHSKRFGSLDMSHMQVA